MPITIANAVFARVPDLVLATPSITTWSRLEPLPHTPDLQAGLQAQVADPLWFVARQWQFNEFQGEDAGTPVDVRLEGESAPLGRYVLGALDSTAAARAIDFQDETLPLEVLVERERVRAVHPRANAEAGLQFMDALAVEGVGNVQSQYVVQYPIGLLDAQEAFGGELVDADGAAWRTLLTGRGIDAMALARDLRPFADANYALSDLPAQPALTAGQKTKVKRAASRWLRWFDESVVEPAATPTHMPEAWNPSRQEYALALSARLSSGPVVLRAAEYTDGELDWYSFDAAVTPDLGATLQPVPPQAFQPRPMLPTQVRYPGMPADRYWEFEDGAVNLGMIEAGPTDLTRMLLAEFGLIFGNDWFIVPLDLTVGSVFQITRLAVRDTFGMESLVEPSRNSDGTAWTMFSHTPAETATAGGRDVFFLAPTLVSKVHSDAVEEVVLFRDEMANMVWGVERRVQGASGESYDRYHETTQQAARQQLLQGKDDPALTADILYRLTTSVPENWMPFVAVPAQPNQPANRFNIRLERRAMLRTLFSGANVLVHPRGVLLRSDLSLSAATEPPLRLEEEEVPREGILVQRVLQHARWLNGHSYVWLGRSKTVDSGEGASGLRFDVIVK